MIRILTTFSTLSSPNPHPPLFKNIPTPPFTPSPAPYLQVTSLPTTRGGGKLPSLRGSCGGDEFFILLTIQLIQGCDQGLKAGRRHGSGSNNGVHVFRFPFSPPLNGPRQNHDDDDDDDDDDGWTP